MSKGCRNTNLFKSPKWYRIITWIKRLQRRYKMRVSKVGHPSSMLLDITDNRSRS